MKVCCGKCDYTWHGTLSSHVLLQLLETAEASTKDVRGLHAKLERKRDVETKNVTLQQSFLQRYTDSIGAMDGSLSEFAAHNRANSAEISTNLSE